MTPLGETAMETAAPAVGSNATPPVSYVSAVWLGMSPEDIDRGIADGVIAAPPGADATVATSTDTLSESSDTAPATSLDPADKPQGKPLLVDRDRVRGILAVLDPALDDDAFDAIWTRAGDSDLDRSNAMVGFLTRALLGGDAAGLSSSATTGDRIASNIAALDAFVSQQKGHAQVVELAGKSGDDLAALARSDPAYRYALLNLDSVAIVGNPSIDAARNIDGVLDRFDPNTGEQNVSDAWLDDRAKFLAWKLRSEAGDSMTVDGADSWTFVDRRGASPDGAPYELQVQASGDGGSANTVIFGADTVAGEILKGGSGTDRIYAGNGDDVLRGDGGGDHLEGGRGDDLLLGGAGNDDLSGDQGADEMDGGAGLDRLRGGAGDDVLTGGRGDDRLEGGAGHDVYVIDPGDGHDTVADSDGSGELRLDGHALTGASAHEGATWQSSDGRARYSFSGDATEGGTLTISYYGVDAAAGAQPETVTTVTGWRNGDLGITLGDGSAGPLDSFADAAAADTAPSNATIPLLPRPDGTSGSDGEGSTWIEPTAAADSAPSDSGTSQPEAAADTTNEVADLFSQLSVHDAIASTVVTHDALHAALDAWDGVAEAPDVMAAHPDADAGASSMGLTANDLASALADFHDDGQDLAEHALTAPTPASMPSSLELLQTSGRAGGTQATGGTGTGQRAGG
jgi:Ca2+-binding RTX toxin-like protein